MTNGNTGIKQGTDGKDIIATRMTEAIRAGVPIGVDKFHTLGLDCQKIVNSKNNFHKVIQKIREVKPYIIITHGSSL